MAPKGLTEEQLLNLKKWLADNEIVAKNYVRDFSDGVLVATLLKKLHPRMVHMHNYPTRNSLQHKTTNWEMLNKKVLSKIGMTQSSTQIENFVTCVPGAMEKFLHQLMISEEKARAELNKPVNEQESLWTANDDVMLITVAKHVGDAIVQVPQKMILFSLYEESVKRGDALEHDIVALQQRVTHLDNMLSLKSERIEELLAQVARLQSSGDAKCPDGPQSPTRPSRRRSHVPANMDSLRFGH